MSTLPPGGLILVTGASGYIAGVTIQILLDRGYHVRGTVRDASKYQWMLSHYGPNFSLITVPELSADGAYDEAVKGVDGIAHIASPTHMAPSAEKMVTPAVKSAILMLEAAAKEPSVKRVVYTSSQTACVHVEPGEEYHADASTWNEESKAAWTLPQTTDFRRMYLNYECAKTEAERACWKWVKEHKPNFTFNALLPDVVFGKPASQNTGFPSTLQFLQLTWEGNPVGPTTILPQYFVDSEDAALLHLAALTLDDLQNERLLGFAFRFSWNEILGIFRKVHPERTFMDDVDEMLDRGTVDNAKEVEILKRMGRNNGFKTLEESIKEWIPGMLEIERKG